MSVEWKAIAERTKRVLQRSNELGVVLDMATKQRRPKERYTCLRVYSKYSPGLLFTVKGYDELVEWMSPADWLNHNIVCEVMPWEDVNWTEIMDVLDVRYMFEDF